MGNSKPPDDTGTGKPQGSAASNGSLLPPRTTSSSSTNTTTSSSSSSSEPSVVTPELPPNAQLPSIYHPSSPDLSPSGSAASTSNSKGESTPRAETSAPVWPLMSSAAPKHSPDLYDEPLTMGNLSDKKNEDGNQNMSRNTSIHRAGSWRKKHASLDTPPTAPRHDHNFPDFSSLKDIPPLSLPENQKPARSCAPAYQRSSLPTPSSPRAYVDPKGARDGRGSSSSEVKWQRAHSPATTGCEISAPKAPPLGYSSFYTQTKSRDSYSGLAPPASSAASTNSSSSGRSSRDPSTPPAPRWAQPPAVTNTFAGRAHSFNDSLRRPDFNLDDFDPELFEGQADEWIEVIKGSEGRIAIKSTPTIYDIMVWLPGFSIDNITIATRGHRTIHIVADQWDEGDHAQWDIKLGEDANLRSVNAKFTGKELRVTVARDMPEWQKARLRNTSLASRSARSNPINTPSITATMGLSLEGYGGA